MGSQTDGETEDKRVSRYLQIERHVRGDGGLAQLSYAIHGILPHRMVTHDLDLSESAQKALHADFRSGGVGRQTERGVAHGAAHFHVAVAQYHELAETVVAHKTNLL